MAISKIAQCHKACFYMSGKIPHDRGLHGFPPSQMFGILDRGQAVSVTLQCPMGEFDGVNIS